jgi:hypothetical protein
MMTRSDGSSLHGEMVFFAFMSILFVMGIKGLRYDGILHIAGEQYPYGANGQRGGWLHEKLPYASPYMWQKRSGGPARGGKERRGEC